MNMRAVIRANRLLAEMGFTNTVEALEELQRLRATRPPAPEEGKDAALLDWMETKVVNVREPLMYGSRDLFWASPDQDDPAFPAGPSDIRAKVRAAMAQGEKSNG